MSDEQNKQELINPKVAKPKKAQKPLGLIAAGTRKIKSTFGDKYQYQIKNIKTAEGPRGCEGYIKNPETGRTIFFTTELASCNWVSHNIMYRLAKDLGEEGWGPSYRNKFVGSTEFEAAAHAVLDSTAKAVLDSGDPASEGDS